MSRYDDLRRMLCLSRMNRSASGSTSALKSKAKSCINHDVGRDLHATKKSPASGWV
jgi:hypothetical protein